MSFQCIVLQNEIAITPSIRLVLPFSSELKTGWWLYLQFLQVCIVIHTDTVIPETREGGEL